MRCSSCLDPKLWHSSLKMCANLTPSLPRVGKVSVERFLTEIVKTHIQRGQTEHPEIVIHLRLMAETDRRVLTLRLLEGLSALEVAGALNLRRADVERRTTLALERLASELGVGESLRRAA